MFLQNPGVGPNSITTEDIQNGAVTLIKTNFTSSPLPVTAGGTGTASPAPVAGTGISLAGTWPNKTITNTSAYATVASPLPIANGGTGTASPGILAGFNMATTGSFPTQTIGTIASPQFTSLLLTNTGPGLVLALTFGATGAASFDQYGNVAAAAGLGLGNYWNVIDTNGNTVASFYVDGTKKIVFAVPLAIASGGTGTATPSMAAGSQTNVTGTWPAQSVNVNNPLQLGQGWINGVAQGSTMDFSIAQFGINIGWNGTAFSLTTDGSNNGGVLFGGNLSGSLDIYAVVSTGATARTLTPAQIQAAMAVQITPSGLLVANKIFKYNGVATAGNGVAAVILSGTATGINTGQTLATVTAPATGLYRVTSYLIVTTAGSSVSQVIADYTDGFGGSASTVIITETSGSPGVGAIEQGTVAVYAKASTGIGIVVSFGASPPTYSIAWTVERL